MSLFTKTANDTFSPYDIAGLPREIVPHDAQVWGTEVEAVVNAFVSGAGTIFVSKASMDANLNYPQFTMAWVLGDAVAANNGIYRKLNSPGLGSWVRTGDLPYSFIAASDAGAGTANAIQAVSSIPVSGSALIWMNVFETNAGSPVTVSFNGGSALTIKTNSGNDVAAGGLLAGMIVLGIVSGSTFRLLSDQASSAIVAAAEAAKIAAEAAQAAAEAAAVAAEATVSETVRYDVVQAKTAAEKLQARTNIAASSSGNDAQFLAGTTRYPTSINQRVDSVSWLAANTVSAKNSVTGAAALDGLTWVNDIMPGTDAVGMVTAYSISPAGKYASVDAVRASDNVALTRQNIIAHAAVAMVDNASVAHFVWGKYTHAWWAATAHADSFLLGEENSVHNEGPDCVAKTPWEIRGGSLNNGQIANLRLTASTGIVGNKVTAAIQVCPNNGKYASGFVIASDALDVVGGYADALAISTNHGIGWYSPNNASAMWRVFCNVTSVTQLGSIILGNGDVQVYNASPDVKTAGHGYRFNGTKVVGARVTGWAADTGTAKRTANATYSGTAEASYTQATIQTLMNAVRDATQTVKALKDDMIAHGLIGA